LICIGEPYRPQGHLTWELNWIKAVYTYADTDLDGCATYEEMLNLYEWGMRDEATYESLIDAYFDAADADGDGLMTWSELNQWLPSVAD